MLWSLVPSGSVRRLHIERGTPRGTLFLGLSVAPWRGTRNEHGRKKARCLAAVRPPSANACWRAGGLRKPVAIQSRVQSPVRCAASARFHAHAARSGRWRLQPEKADGWLDAVVSRMRDIWRPHNEQADGLLANASARLWDNGKKKPRPPDNFMGRDLADVVQERYPRIFGAAGTHSDVKQLNRGIYAALSRDSHARLRIELAALTILPSGTVRVIPRRVDETARRRTLLRCLESSLTEAIGAVSYLLETRRQTDAEKLRSIADRAIANDLPPSFSPDLGLWVRKHRERRHRLRERAVFGLLNYTDQRSAAIEMKLWKSRWRGIGIVRHHLLSLARLASDVCAIQQVAEAVLEMGLACLGIRPLGTGALGSDVRVPTSWPRAEHFFSTRRTEHSLPGDISGCQPVHVRDHALLNVFGRNGISIRANISRPAKRPRGLAWLGSLAKRSRPNPPFLAGQVSVDRPHCATVEKVFRRKQTHHGIQDVRVAGHVRRIGR
jgi:hypothetical protein